MARALLVLALLGTALCLAAPASAAAPDYILVSGPGLSRPVLLADRRQNMKLLIAVANAPRARGQAVADLWARRRFDLAEFWAWAGKPRPTDPPDASQHGSFSPGRGSRPAVVVLRVEGTVVPRLAPALLLRVLARCGVPTRT